MTFLREVLEQLKDCRGWLLFGILLGLIMGWC